MTEAIRTTLFIKYARTKIKETFVGECKISKTESLPFSSVKDHQENALYRAKHGTLSYKIPDVGYDQKPMDLFQVYRCPAYIIIFWYTKPGDKRMSIIDIDSWITEKEKSIRKSLTYQQSCIIGKCYTL